MTVDEVRSAFRRSELQDRERLVLDIVRSNAPPSCRLLDVGCYVGHFLEHLRRCRPDMRLTGVDASMDHLAASRVVFDLDAAVSQTSVYQLAFADEAFDCVTFQEVIEHLDRPVDAVREINRVLRPGGLLVLSTPNANGGAWRLILSSLKSRLTGGPGYHAAGNAIYFESSPWNRHIFAWTPTTLNTLLLVNGFEYVAHRFFTENALERLLPQIAAGMVFITRKAGRSPVTLV
ncbi:MAG TPA: class I SAM-dependent methyltransferase [Chloroflexota bacterium]|nr:class I SAM-dependent methyltransferase [Chloroflexota bacterium]